MRKAKILYRLTKSYILYKVGKPRIAELVFYITTRCNLRCVFCDRWRNIPRREITTEEAIKILYDRLGINKLIVSKFLTFFQLYDIFRINTN